MTKDTVKKCPQCGKTFVGYKKQICCSIKCGAKHRKPRTESNESQWRAEDGPKSPCLYQETVRCAVRKCNKCGWNPEVAKARTEAYERNRRNRRVKDAN